MDLLKLTALDQDDLEVISAHMQDAVIKFADIRYLKPQNKFVLVANRFVWDAGGAKRPTHERRRSGLLLARVLSVRSQNIRRDAGDAVLSLLAIGFEPAEAPSGRIVLSFSGGGTIGLDVECIEAQLDDLGPAWETKHMPSHDREPLGSS